MTKPLDFRTYKSLRKKSLNDMNRWAEAFYAAAYEQGQEDLREEFEDQYIKKTDLDKIGNTYNEDQLIEKLMTVPGIGKARAQQAADALLEYYDEEESET